MEHETITRAEAKARGLKRYFTGKPCKNGHVDERATNSGHCVACDVLWSAKRYERDRDKICAAVRAYGARNKEKVSAANKAKLERYRRDHPERLQRYSANYTAANRERLREYCRWYRSTDEGKAKRAAYEAWRRARKQNATPPWADQEEIEAFYRARPPGYEVDHIIPLKGKTVSGLHTLDNLQYLTMSDNRKKNAKFIHAGQEISSVSHRF